MEYTTPPLYFGLHICIGMISFYYPELFVLNIGYQLLQLLLDSRFFLFSWEIKKGNSIEYTLYKIMQYMVGICIMYIYTTFFKI